MLYTTSITIPANTPASSPVTKDIMLKSGVLTKVSVLIPAGHFALAHLIIRYGGTQIIPDVGDISGDDETLSWSEYIDIPEPHRTLTLVGWNDDDTYAHTFYIRFEILPKIIALPQLYFSEIIEKALRILRLR